ncbi:MAG: hypothetical protein M3480_08730 [Verrucomicrobiota bacterium]|nr:hypothetical protein [Chthoniobacterales bacterium]MDQ3415032.1 hypothetical protein [Verrucomicrobiota bacterium]
MTTVKLPALSDATACLDGVTWTSDNPGVAGLLNSLVRVQGVPFINPEREIALRTAAQFRGVIVDGLPNEYVPPADRIH